MKEDPVRRLEAIMAKLRSENGCPWDREQTHRSLRPYLIEEAYEAVEAIDSGDPAKIGRVRPWSSRWAVSSRAFSRLEVVIAAGRSGAPPITTSGVRRPSARSCAGAKVPAPSITATASTREHSSARDASTSDPAATTVRITDIRRSAASDSKPVSSSG